QAYFKFIDDRRVEESIDLADDLECTFSAFEVNCQRDDRQVDGPRTEVFFNSEFAGYRARKIITSSGFGTPASTDVTTLATGLAFRTYEAREAAMDFTCR